MIGLVTFMPNFQGTASMYRRSPANPSLADQKEEHRPDHSSRVSTPQVRIKLDGEWHVVPASLSVAAAVLSIKGWQHYRRHFDESFRAPLCMMGICHECLIRIDGRPNRQGCLERVMEGMEIERQGGCVDDE